MRKILAFLLLSVGMCVAQGMPMGGIPISTGGGGSAPGVAQSTYCEGAYDVNPATTCVFSGNVTSGNILVVFASGSPTSYNTPTGTGTGCVGLTYTAVGTPGAGSDSAAIWTATVVSTGACTVNISAVHSGGTTLGGAAVEVSGGTTTGIDYSAYTAVDCSSCTGNSVTTTDNNALFIGYVGQPDTGSTMTALTPFNTWDVNHVTGYYGMVVGHATVNASTVSQTFTSSNYGTMSYAAIVIPHP